MFHRLCAVNHAIFTAYTEHDPLVSCMATCYSKSMQQNYYFATFPAGCYPIIVKHLKSFSIDEIRIDEQDESSVTFYSPLRVEKIIEFRYFTNVYLIVQHITELPDFMIRGEYFRLMSLKNGAPSVLDVTIRHNLEQDIIKNLGLTPNSHLSLNDFYCISRSSDREFIGLRLARPKFKREDLQPGALRPEIAHILCLSAGVKAKDVVLDMFAGYGSIPLEAVRGFGCKQVIAVDHEALAGRHELPAIDWRTDNACKLDTVEDGSINRVVTDPPWGVYDTEKDPDLLPLYSGFTLEMVRILKKGGIAVVLTSWPHAEEYFTKQLNLVGKWNILVSGKKATVFKLQKT